MPPRSVPIEHIITAYRELGSVWKAGRRLGLTGQTVHWHLNKAGINTSKPPEFTDEQIARIRQFYEVTPDDQFNLQALADELGKSRHNVCRTARRLGLTSPRRSPSDVSIVKLRRKRWAKGAHPRGMLGKRHSDATKQVISARGKLRWATDKTFGIGQMSPEARNQRSERLRLQARSNPSSRNYTRAAGGFREDLGGKFFRSSWEANYARYLNLLIKLGVVERWEFEPKTFWFDDIKRGVVSYLPDFAVKYKGDERIEYIEVKGWVTPKDRVKWKRMAKYYPETRLVIVGAKQYYALCRKWASSIPNWETGKDGKAIRILRRSTTVSPLGGAT